MTDTYDLARRNYRLLVDEMTNCTPLQMGDEYSRRARKLLRKRGLALVESGVLTEREVFE